MEKKLTFYPFQKALAVDVQHLGDYAQQSFDDLIHELCYPGVAYTGFPVVKSAAAQVNVGLGHMLSGGKMYFNDTAGGVNVDLIPSRPLASYRQVAIVISGSQEPEVPQKRSFVNDPVTRSIVQKYVTTEVWRWADVGIIEGEEAPSPQPPAVPGQFACVAFVLLDVNGVVTITPALDQRATNIDTLKRRADATDVYLATVGALIQTLRSDIAALAARFKTVALFTDVEAIAQDVGKLKNAAAMPENYSAFASDHFLDLSQTDITNVDSYCRVMEGVRFASAQIQDATLLLLDPANPNVVNTNNFVLPKYDPETRISFVANDAEASVDMYEHQVVTATLLSATRTRIRYGTPFDVCQNNAWYQQGHVNSDGVFVRNGETFNEVFLYNGAPGKGHKIFRLTEFWTDTYTDSWWVYNTTEEGINGSIFSQSFLNSQSGYLLEIGLYFSRVSAVGDVTMLIVECGTAGPDLTTAIAKTTVPAGALKVSPQGGAVRTPFVFNPTILEAGKRYAWVIITVGDHYLWQAVNNKYLDGSSFISTDGSFQVGDLTKDFNFDAVFAKFRASQVAVDLQPIGLPGGIVGIDINADTSTPDGTSIAFAYQQNGVYTEIAPGTSITGLPAQLPLRAIFQGSTAVMPGLGIGPRSQTETTRPAAFFKHISKPYTDPNNATANTVIMDVVLEHWRGAPHHTFTCQLGIGPGYGQYVDPAAVTIEVDPDDSTTITYHLTFDFTASPIHTFTRRMSGTTDNTATCYLVNGATHSMLNHA